VKEPREFGKKGKRAEILGEKAHERIEYIETASCLGVIPDHIAQIWSPTPFA